MNLSLMCLFLIQGHKPSSSRTRDVAVLQVNPIESPASSNSFSNHSQLPSQLTDVESPNSVHNLDYEDAESGINHTSISCYASSYTEYRSTDSYSNHAFLSVYLKRNSMQQIIQQVPDTTLSLRCSSMIVEKWRVSYWTLSILILPYIVKVSAYLFVISFQLNLLSLTWSNIVKNFPGDLQGQYTESASQFYSSMPENVNKDLDGTGFESAFIGSKTQFDQASWNEVLQHATAQMPSDHNNFQATVDGELYADNVNFRLDVCSALKKSARKVLSFNCKLILC